MGERQITPCRQSLSEEFEIKGMGEGRETEEKRKKGTEICLSLQKNSGKEN